MGRAIDALIAYRLLKLLVTPFNKTKAYKLKELEDQRLKVTEEQNIKEELASKLQSFDVDQNSKN